MNMLTDILSIGVMIIDALFCVLIGYGFEMLNIVSIIAVVPAAIDVDFGQPIS